MAASYKNNFWFLQIRHIQKLANDRKSTPFGLFTRNLGKIFTSWSNHLHKVSRDMKWNCGFFTND